MAENTRMVDLEQLQKLIRLAQPPASGSDEEAKRASLLVCKIIRDSNLYVYDPKSKQATKAAEGDLAARYAEAVYNNPTRAAMRQRQQDRLRREQELEDAKSKIVG